MSSVEAASRSAKAVASGATRATAPPWARPRCEGFEGVKKVDQRGGQRVGNRRLALVRDGGGDGASRTGRCWRSSCRRQTISASSLSRLSSRSVHLHSQHALSGIRAAGVSEGSHFGVAVPIRRRSDRMRSAFPPRSLRIGITGAGARLASGFCRVTRSGIALTQRQVNHILDRRNASTMKNGRARAPRDALTHSRRDWRLQVRR